MIGLEVIFQTISLNGDVLVAFGNTSLNTQRLEPGTLPQGCSEARGGERNEPVHDAEDGQSVQRASSSVRTSYRNPNLPGKQPTVDTR